MTNTPPSAIGSATSMSPHRQPVAVEFGCHVPVVIQQPDAYHPGSDAAEVLPVALHVARQQQHVGQHEVERDQRPAHPLPAVLGAHPVVRDLFLGVRRVDDDELRERQVGPQHDEGEQQLAQVVEVRRVHDVVHRPLFRQPGEHEDREGERRQALADDVKQAPHRREPVRVDRHRPIDDGEGHGEAEEQQPAARQTCHLFGQRRVAGAVLFGRPRAEAHRHERPHREVEDVATDEERHVQVGGLVGDDRVTGDHVGVGPVVQVPPCRTGSAGRARP